MKSPCSAGGGGGASSLSSSKKRRRPRATKKASARRTTMRTTRRRAGNRIVRKKTSISSKVKPKTKPKLKPKAQAKVVDPPQRRNIMEHIQKLGQSAVHNVMVVIASVRHSKPRDIAEVSDGRPFVDISSTVSQVSPPAAALPDASAPVIRVPQQDVPASTSKATESIARVRYWAQPFRMTWPDVHEDTQAVRHCQFEYRMFGLDHGPLMSHLLDREYWNRLSDEEFEKHPGRILHTKDEVMAPCCQDIALKLFFLETLTEQPVDGRLIVLSQPIEHPKFGHVFFDIEKTRDDKKQWLGVTSATADVQIHVDTSCLCRIVKRSPLSVTVSAPPAPA